MHGIGGSTVQEAKERLSVAEVSIWQAYRAKRGSLNVGLMVESSMARLSSMYANVHSKNGGIKPLDFMPHFDEPVLTLDEAMRTWG